MQSKTSDDSGHKHYVFASLEVLETMVVVIARSLERTDPELMTEIKRRLELIRDEYSERPESEYKADSHETMKGTLARVNARLDMGF